MRTSVTKIAYFNAAHSLPEHDGKCRGLHGHTYKIEVTVTGGLQQTGPGSGMVVDFGTLQDVISGAVTDVLDHTHLNEVLDIVPTAEAIALWAFERLTERGLNVVRVRLWETPTSFAEVEPGEA